MHADWQISAGAFTDALGPLAYLLAAIASTWILSALRRRTFKMPAALSLALLTFPLIYALPLVFSPLLLIAWMYLRRRSDIVPVTPEGETSEAQIDAPSVVEKSDASARRRRPLNAFPLLYAALLIAPGTLYFMRDYRTIDARLARAHRDELHKRTESAIREYRAALQLEDDPHTHKLLGRQLAGARREEEALAEFDTAERGGEPDALLAYHIASTLDSLGRPLEAAGNYEEFLMTSACTDSPADVHCEVARSRLNETAAPRVTN